MSYCIEWLITEEPSAHGSLHCFSVGRWENITEATVEICQPAVCEEAISHSPDLSYEQLVSSTTCCLE